MLIYILVAIFPLFIGNIYENRIKIRFSEAEIDSKRSRKTRWWWILISALPMFTLIAFRGSALGSDTLTYLRIFKEVSNTPWNRLLIVNDATYEFEHGFVIFEKLISLVTSTPQIYQIIYSTIYLIAVVTFANQLEKHNFSFLYFFATLGIYTFMFTGVRQSLAMCICLLSYPLVKRRRFVPFALLVVLAFTFHKSAILFLAVYFIYGRKINFINSIFYASFAVVAYIYIEVIQNWFNDTLDYEYNIEKTGNGAVFFIVIILITAFSFFAILHYRKQTFESVGLLNVGIITLIFWLLRLATRVAERPSYYFMFFTAAMLCYGVDAPKSSIDRLLVKSVIYVAFMLLYIYRFSTNFATLVPYATFF